MDGNRVSDLRVLPGRYSVCRLAPDASLPEHFFSATRTPDELSVVCDEVHAPENAKCEAGWRLMQVAGPLEFSLTGVLAAIAAPLAKAGVSIFALSTFDTDYVLVKEDDLAKAIEALRGAGHGVCYSVSLIGGEGQQVAARRVACAARRTSSLNKTAEGRSNTRRPIW
jgi:hypothetical protein